MRGYWLSGLCRSLVNLNRTQNFGHWLCFCPVAESSYSYQAQQRSCCSISFTCGWKQVPPVQRCIVYGIPKNGQKSRNQMYDIHHEYPTEDVLDMLHNHTYIAGWFHYEIRWKYRVIQNDCRGFTDLSYIIHLRQEYMYFFIQ